MVTALTATPISPDVLGDDLELLLDDPVHDVVEGVGGVGGRVPLAARYVEYLSACSTLLGDDDEESADTGSMPLSRRKLYTSWERKIERLITTLAARIEGQKTS
jgi:hypothetical protein